MMMASTSLYGLQQFGLFAVFLQQHQLVACCFYFLTDAVYSHFGKTAYLLQLILS